jgi:HSP20 family molecular chaperone IbpA
LPFTLLPQAAGNEYLLYSMKTPRGYIDLGTIFDELFDAADKFRSEFNKNFSYTGGFQGRPCGSFFFDENTDYYPGFSYPPMNIFLTEDKSLNFEFALAGFDEKNITLSFQGDYMIFSALIGEENAGNGEGAETQDVYYLKRRLKLKDIDRQKYFVPLDKYDHEKVRAVFKNGILRVTVPPKPETARTEGVTIAIIKEGN